MRSRYLPFDLTLPAYVKGFRFEILVQYSSQKIDCHRTCLHLLSEIYTNFSFTTKPDIQCILFTANYHQSFVILTDVLLQCSNQNAVVGFTLVSYFY